MRSSFLSTERDFNIGAKQTGILGSIAAFFVAPIGYFLIFTIWRLLWAKGLFHKSVFIFPIFFIAEFLIVLAGWDRAPWPFDKILPRFWASIISAVLKGVVICIPAYALVNMMRSLAWTAQFVPFVYEAEWALFANRWVLFAFWAFAFFVPLGIFIALRRFRVTLSTYVPLAIIFAVFINIYNAYDRLTKADSKLDPIVEVICSRAEIDQASGVSKTRIARDIYVEDKTVFASFGTTLSPISSLMGGVFSNKRPKRSIAIVRLDVNHGWLDVIYGSTVKYFFSRPEDPYLYFAIWSEYPEIYQVKKKNGMVPKRVIPFIFESLERWDRTLPLLSVMDLYVDKANKSLYFSADELPACFRIDIESQEVTGEVNLLKMGMAPWGSGVRRIHVDPQEQYMYLVTYAAPASVVKIDLNNFTLAAQRPSDSPLGRLFVFYHDVAFDWNRSIGYGFTFDGRAIEAFRLSDLMTLYKVKTNLSPMRLQVRGAHVLDDGKVVAITYFGELFLFDPEKRELSLLCSRTGGRVDDLEISGGHVYLNNYAGVVRIPLDKLLERAR